MKRTDFENLMEANHRYVIGLNQTKGHDYAGDEDALDNFKRNALSLGLTPEQVWAVYAAKHWDAIMTYVREGAVQSEPVEGRLLDVILYCHLMLGLVRERGLPPEAPL
jgi:hypothetical protein